MYSVNAKRTPPPIINPIEINGYKYCANFKSYFLFGFGIIDVYNLATQEKVKEIVIYRVAYNPLQEKDVQWVFIRDMKQINGNTIRIVNEKENAYDLNTNTMKVVRVKEKA
jgi:uncharacterized Rmd1/YagE family protein